MGTGSRPGRAWALADRAGGRVPVPILRDGPGRCGGRGTGTSAALRSQSPFRLRSELRTCPVVRKANANRSKWSIRQVGFLRRVRSADRPLSWVTVRGADPTETDVKPLAGW